MNRVWLTDIAEHKTREGTLYCCAVLDLYSRRVVGWAIDRRKEAAMVNDALTMAAKSRTTPPETILHRDHGSQFVSWAFTQNLRYHSILGSMGTVGDCFDNAPMESFWGSMQIELLNRQAWMTHVQLSTAIADYIVNFYNPRRRHSSLGYLAREIRRVTIVRQPGHDSHRCGPLTGVHVSWTRPRGPGQRPRSQPLPSPAVPRTLGPNLDISSLSS